MLATYLLRMLTGEVLSGLQRRSFENARKPDDLFGDQKQSKRTMAILRLLDPKLVDQQGRTKLARPWADPKLRWDRCIRSNQTCKLKSRKTRVVQLLEQERPSIVGYRGRGFLRNLSNTRRTCARDR